MQNNLKIPKNKKHVKLSLDDGTIIEEKTFFIFLNKFSAYKTGEETLDEFLNSDKLFLPFEDKKTSKVLLINKENILYLSFEFLEKYESSVKILADFGKGREKKFDFVNENQFYRSRLADALNDKELFIPFYFEKEKFYVNRKHIKMVKEL